MQYEQRFSGAAANHGDFGARRAGDVLGRGRHDLLLGLVRAMLQSFIAIAAAGRRTFA